MNDCWFGSQFGTFCYGNSGSAFHKTSFSLLFSKVPQLLCSDLQFRLEVRVRGLLYGLGFWFGFKFKV